MSVPPAPQRVVPPLADQPLIDGTGRPTFQMTQWMQRLSAFLGPVVTTTGSGGSTTNLSLSEQVSNLTTEVAALQAEGNADFSARAQIAALTQTLLSLKAIINQQAQQPGLAYRQPQTPPPGPGPFIPSPQPGAGPGPFIPQVPPAGPGPFIPPSSPPAGPGLAFVPPPSGIVYLANGARLLDGYGAPNSLVYGWVGDAYLQIDGSAAGLLWVKASGVYTNTGWIAPLPGTVTEVDTGTGLTGGPITGTGTVSLAAIASHDILSNITGGSAAPVPNTVSDTLDAAIGSTQGDILYRGASSWSVLTPGTAGQYLQTAGASANPTWGTVADVGRNYVGNALFWVAQRGAGPFTTSAVYTLDRWQMLLTTDTMSVTQATLSDTDRSNIGNEQAESGLANAWTSAGSNASFNLVSHKMEDVYRLANKTVTVSFWAKAAAGTPKVGVNFTQHFGTGGGPSANVDVNGQSVTLSTTFARYQLTFSLPSVAGKTIGSSNTDQTQLHFWYSSGTTNATLAGIGVQASGTITLWGVQCEIGSVATPLEIKSFAEEIADCERFFIGGAQVVINGYGVIAAGVGQTYSWATRMRGVPTITITSSANINVSGFTVAVLSNKAGWFNGTVTATGGWTVNAVFTVTAEI